MKAKEKTQETPQIPTLSRAPHNLSITNLGWLVWGGVGTGVLGPILQTTATP